MPQRKFWPTEKSGGAFNFLRRLAAVRLQEKGWYEPCKSRGLSTVLWAAGGEIPPADPAIAGGCVWGHRMVVLLAGDGGEIPPAYLTGEDFTSNEFFSTVGILHNIRLNFGGVIVAYHLRRHDRQLKTRKEIDEILNRGKFVVLSLCQDNEPYIVTLSYGYDQSQNCLYLHCANEGTKLEFIKKNSSVCGTVIIDKGYIDNKCGHEYETVVLRGNLQFVDTLEEKRLGIETILSHLETNPQPIIQKTFKSEAVFKTITVLRLGIFDITGKKGR